jgi:hypothetical protein
MRTVFASSITQVRARKKKRRASARWRPGWKSRKSNTCPGGAFGRAEVARPGHVGSPHPGAAGQDDLAYPVQPEMFLESKRAEKTQDVHLLRSAFCCPCWNQGTGQRYYLLRVCYQRSPQSLPRSRRSLPPPPPPPPPLRPLQPPP